VAERLQAHGCARARLFLASPRPFSNSSAKPRPKTLLAGGVPAALLPDAVAARTRLTEATEAVVARAEKAKQNSCGPAAFWALAHVLAELKRRRAHTAHHFEVRRFHGRAPLSRKKMT
jgi:hypothetical protein